MSDIILEVADILRPSYLKIARAKKHILDLQREIDAFLGTKPAKLVIRDDRAAGQTIRSVKQNSPVPETISLIIGDAVHNLRCALDLTVFAIVGDKTPSPQSVQFPWAWSPEKLEATLTTRQMRHAGKNVIDAVKALEPYPGGNEAIEAVHRLDITDKHQLILTAVSSAEMTLEEFSRFVPADTYRAQAARPDKRNITLFLTAGSEWTLNYRFKGNRTERRGARSKIAAREYEADVQPTFHICFDTSLPVVGMMPVIDCLVGMTTRIEEACLQIGRAHAADLLGAK
ncbi:MAG: hypothetical protein ACT4N8_08570 [Sphingosinicella sp.]|uniref:hypothetical protein n=1 Tax=Sphingosinicella sp. TaxID=1917971 RepID=UPI004037C047